MMNRCMKPLSQPRRHILTECLPMIILLLSVCASASATDLPNKDILPVYSSLKPNIKFWTDVYSNYTTRQCIIHDRDQVNLIYEVIPLVSQGQTKARKINRKRIKKAKKKHKNILLRLAAGHKPKSKTENDVAMLFGPEAKLKSFKNAAYQIRCQIGQKDRFRQGIIRSGAYLDAFRKIFAKHGVPQDLAYLPHVESSFNVKAYSKFGAAGIWQFTRSTGRRFLDIDYVRDERRDPFLATEAAVKLFKENHSKLGNWPMAITAYNHGANGMLRAKKRHGNFESVFNKYSSRTFGFASRNFYTEFLAARHVARHYKKYFGNLPLDKPQTFTQIKMPGYLSFDDMARHFKLMPSKLALLNPALRKPVLTGQKYIPKGYRLKLPPKVDLTAIPKKYLKKKQKRSHFHTVRRGESAYLIAKIHGIKLNDLIIANNLNRRATIYPKQNLIIPGMPPQKPQVKKTLAKPDKAPKIVIASSKNFPVKTSSKKKSGKAPSYHVTFSPVEQLKKAEASGQQKQSAQAVTIASAKNKFFPGVVTGNLRIFDQHQKNGRTYGFIEVAPEETLGHFGDWLEIKTQRLRGLNGLAFGRSIRLHQKLKIPLNKVNKDIFEERRFLFHKEVEEDFFSAYKLADAGEYIVQTGDNIWSLCQEKFEVPLWLLIKYIPELNPDNLHPGQMIRFPVVEPL